MSGPFLNAVRSIAGQFLPLLLGSCSCAIYREEFRISANRESAADALVAGLAEENRFTPRSPEDGAQRFQRQDVELLYDPAYRKVIIRSSHCPRAAGLAEWENRCKEATQSIQASFSRAGVPLRKGLPIGLELGPLPTREDAMDAAELLWVSIYGKENIERKKPFRATLKDGVWHVSGSLPDGWVGGVPVAELRKSDGKILKVSHGK